jgi:hypothetical protein
MDGLDERCQSKQKKIDFFFRNKDIKRNKKKEKEKELFCSNAKDVSSIGKI